MEPFVSVVMTIYNGQSYLKESINSILEQQYQNFEFIIVNDGSADTTSEVAFHYCNSDSRIRLVEKENGGLSSARNKGIENANGNRFIFLDSDDFLYEKCLEKEIAHICLQLYAKFEKNQSVCLF